MKENLEFKMARFGEFGRGVNDQINTDHVGESGTESGSEKGDYLI